jgi:short-subunit dehydrogenase
MRFSNNEKNRLFTKFGSWAIVTGASSGIGREIVLRLAEAGFSLLINARDHAKLESLKQALEAQGVTVAVVAADMGTEEGREQLILASRQYDIGMLVAAAGYGTSGEFLHSRLESEVNMIQVNCEGALALTHHFARVFAQKKRGGIVLFSSLVAFQGVPYSANYAATKAYIQSLVEGLALELKPHGVDVLAAAPGPVVSGFGERANMQMDMALKPEQVGLPILKALGRKTTVLPGLLTKFLVYSLRMLPRWGKIRVMKLVMGGMTKHQREVGSVHSKTA